MAWLRGKPMKNSKIQPAKVIAFWRCAGDADLTGRFRLTQASNLTDCASGAAVSHLADNWRVLQ